MLAYDLHINQVWPSDAIYCYRACSAMVLVIPLAWRYGNLHLITKFHLKTHSGAIPHNALQSIYLKLFQDSMIIKHRFMVFSMHSSDIISITGSVVIHLSKIICHFFSLGINCHLRLFTGCQSKWSGGITKKYWHMPQIWWTFPVKFHLYVCHKTSLITAFDNVAAWLFIWAKLNAIFFHLPLIVT